MLSFTGDAERFRKKHVSQEAVEVEYYNIGSVRSTAQYASCDTKRELN